MFLACEIRMFQVLPLSAWCQSRGTTTVAQDTFGALKRSLSAGSPKSQVSQVNFCLARPPASAATSGTFAAAAAGAGVR